MQQVSICKGGLPIVEPCLCDTFQGEVYAEQLIVRAPVVEGLNTFKSVQPGFWILRRSYTEGRWLHGLLKHKGDAEGAIVDFVTAFLVG